MEKTLKQKIWDNFETSRRKNIFFIVCTVLAVLMQFTTHYRLWVLPAFVILLYVELNLKISKEGKVWHYLGELWSLLLLALSPLLTEFLVQHIILEKELYKKFKPTPFIWNTIMIAVVTYALFALFASARWAFIVSNTFFFIVAAADYYVYEFRQNEISYNDLDTIDTGISVAKNYSFELNNRLAMALMLTVLAYILMWRFTVRFRNRWIRTWILRVLAVVCAVTCFNNIKDGKAMKQVTQTWEKKGTYVNGFLLNFFLGIRDSHVDPPAGYSLEKIDELVDEYTTDAGSVELEKNADGTLKADNVTGKAPTIITIMDESFADFRIISGKDTLNTDVDVMPYMDSMEENTIKGFSLASVFGAKTPNSEWEYMTGNTMAFMPGGSVVYQQFMPDEPTSIVSNLKNMGYDTVAMHPYYAAGWRRNTVYPRMGFNEMYFMDDEFQLFDTTAIMRDYITDQEMFDQVIKRYEQQQEESPNTPMFLMGITMQNHGGYKKTYDNFSSKVHYLDYVDYHADSSDPTVDTRPWDQYLTVSHATDDAVKNLIEYFKTVDEPVVICFFGDHLPSLPDAFYESLNGKGVTGLTLSQLENLFTVPFFIWANYDIEEQEVERTSFNYLHTKVLQAAGLPLPAYNQFLADMEQVIPAINSRGYYSASTKTWKHVSAASGTDLSWIKKYDWLQYNNVFETDDQSKVFFPYLTGELEENE